MTTTAGLDDTASLGADLRVLDAAAEQDPSSVDIEDYLALADRAAAGGDEDVEVLALLGAAGIARSIGPFTERAVAALERAVSRTHAIPSNRGLAKYNLAIATRDGDPDRAKQLLADAASAFISADDFGRAATSLLEKGEIEGATGNREAALSCFVTARDMARRARNPWQVAKADDRIAAAHWELGRVEVAERHLRDALAIWEADGDPGELAWARYRLAWCIANDVRTNDRANETLNLLDRARATAQANGNLRLVADCDHQASAVFEDRGEFERAVSLLRSAATVYDALGEDDLVATARVNLAEKLILLGFRLDGEELLRGVVASQTAGSNARTGAASRLARCLVRSNRSDEALRVLDDVDQLVDHDNRLEATRYLLARAATYNALNMVQATEEAAKHALANLEGTDLPTLHAEALEFLARCADFHGDRARAEALLGQAVALFLVSGDEQRARELAGEIAPPPPDRDPTDEREVEAFTGQYL